MNKFKRENTNGKQIYGGFFIINLHILIKYIKTCLKIINSSLIAKQFIDYFK